MKMTDKQIFGELAMHEHGKALREKFAEMRDEHVKDLDRADDVQLRKLAGSISILTDILAEFDEHTPEMGE